MGSSAAYVATGALETPANFTQEMGSANAPPVRELVPELGNRLAALRTYDKMARTDTVCSVALKAAKVPILGADFYVDPEGEDQVNMDAAQFVEYNLFQGMSTAWSYVLTRILKMYQHGYSIFEPVYMEGKWSPSRRMANSKQYTMLRKLAYRPASSIADIIYDDNGGPETILHNAIRADGKTEKVEIPIEKAIIFTMGDSDSLFGDSILRAAYAHWYYKTHLYKIDAIQKERHGIGVPYGELPPGFQDKDRIAMDELLANLRTNERAFATIPPGYKIGFMKPEGQLVDVLQSASHHDVLILMNVLAQFLMLGTNDQSGSRAVSGAQLDIFYKSEWFIATMICDYFNQYLIPKLVLYNFEVDTIPQLKVRNIGQSRDLQQLAAALANVVNAEIVTNDIDTENWTRDLFDMPRKKGDRPAEPQPTKVTEQITKQDGGTPQNGTAPSGNGARGGTQPKSPTAT